MQPHSDVGKTSTVTFQWLNQSDCHHIDLHSNLDLGQDVQINMKPWYAETIEESYIAKLPVGEHYQKEGLSISAANPNTAWITFSVTTTQPIDKAVSIYAYCRSSIDELTNDSLTQVTTSSTELSKKYYYFGNASLISSASNGESGNYGTKTDVFVTSTVYEAEGIFQVLSSEQCEKVEISDDRGSTEVEEVLMKGWSEATWKETDCASLPCTLNLYKRSDGIPSYTLISVKTNRNKNNKISATCENSPITIAIKEKESKPKHPNNCQFSDVPKNDFGYYPYVTAFCSAQIVEGYGPNYTQFKPENSANWAELTKVVNLAANYYKTMNVKNDIKYDNLTPENWHQPYIDIAKKQYFDKDPALEVTHGIAYQYIVKVFWNKRLNETDAATFLRDKGISYRSNTSTLMKRGYMAEIILKSSRMSADENGIERKLPYVNHPSKELANIITLVTPPPLIIWDELKETDTDEKKKETINKNVKTTVRSNTTLSEKDHTNNTGLTIAILGGKNSLKEEYQDKNITEIIEKTREKGVMLDIDTWIGDEDPVFLLTRRGTSESFLVTASDEKDDEGKKKFVVEISPQKVKVVDEATLRNEGFVVEGKIRLNDFIR